MRCNCFNPNHLNEQHKTQKQKRKKMKIKLLMQRERDRARDGGMGADIGLATKNFSP